MGVNRISTHHAHDKWRVMADWFVDDKVSHLEAWTGVWGPRGGRSVRFAQPWNAGARAHFSVLDWPALVDLIAREG